MKEEVYFRRALIFHCRDKPGSTEAEELLFQIVYEELPGFDLDDMKIHHHCFNGGLDLYRKWSRYIPHMKFGITAILLREERHPELEAVVDLMQLEEILLETDSPHLIAPVHGRGHNTPYGLVEVARRVAELKNYTIDEVLRVTSATAMCIYGLKLK